MVNLGLQIGRKLSAGGSDEVYCLTPVTRSKTWDLLRFIDETCIKQSV